MNEVQNKKTYTLKVVLITLLVVLLVGCISFIVYDKFIKKENSNPTITDKDKNNELSVYIRNGINFFDEIYENEIKLFTKNSHT